VGSNPTLSANNADSKAVSKARYYWI